MCPPLLDNGEGKRDSLCSLSAELTLHGQYMEKLRPATPSPHNQATEPTTSEAQGTFVLAHAPSGMTDNATQRADHTAPTATAP